MAIQILFFSFCVFILSAHSVTHGQIVDWLNTTGAPDPWYHLGGNWVGGTAPGATDTARFNQAGAYEAWWDGTTASTTPEVRFLEVLQGDVTFLNNGGGTQWEYTINGSGGGGSFSDFSISGANTTLTNRGLHLHSLGGGQIINGATLTLDGSHAQGSRMTVDGNIGFDVSGNLNVQSGAIFETSIGHIGREIGSTGIATVTGIGSQWNSSGILRVGTSGSGTLNVYAGGVVRSSSGSIAQAHESVSNVTVTGVGSQWISSGSIFIGGDGFGSLSVEAGGRVDSEFSYIGTSNVEGLGTATVTGFGSSWFNSGNLQVGFGGNGVLQVEAGGKVFSDFGSIASYESSTGAVTVTGIGSNWQTSFDLSVGGRINVAGGTGSLRIAESGRVIVGGTTKLWNTGTLTLDGGDLITGTLDNTENGTFDFYSGTLGITDTNQGLTVKANQFLLANGGTFNTEAGTTTLAAGQHLAIAGTTKIASEATLTMSGGSLTTGTFDHTYGGTFAFQDGALTVIGGTFDPGAGPFKISGNTLSATPTLVLSDGATGSLSDEIIVGNIRQGFLTVSGGSQLSNTNGILGNLSGSAGTATVTGIGSQWNNSGDLFIGGNSTGAAGAGSLTISDSGSVNVSGTTKFWNSGSLTLDGGSLTTHTFDNTAGGTFNFNDGTLTVVGGVFDPGTSSFIINGNIPSATPRLVLSSGATSSLTGELTVGNTNQGFLTISEGSQLNSAYGTIGIQSGSTGAAIVTGEDSQWINQGDLNIGFEGTGSLTIENAGYVENDIARIGYASGVEGSVVVAGAGSEWNVLSQLQIGRSGIGSLTIESGGKVSSGLHGYVGTNDNGIGYLTITGTGSELNTFGNYIGTFDQSFGEVNVEFDGKFNSGVIWVGATSGATGILNVNDGVVDLTVNNEPGFGYLDVGREGTGTMVITGGGLVDALYGIIGTRDGSIGNATVSGSGSQWLNQNGLDIGGTDLFTTQGGTGTLAVANGGFVTNTVGRLAVATDSIGSATVTGSGSQWINSGHLDIGVEGAGTLTIENGGHVGATGRIHVGEFGSGAMTLSDGATVVSGDARFGVQAGSTGIANIDNSSWTGVNNFHVGQAGDGTVTISNGGLVSNNYGYIGEGGGVGIMNVDNGTWQNQNSVFVGGGTGQGTLNVTNGGTLVAASVFVGRQDGGTLSVSSGGNVTTSLGRIGEFSNADGDVTISGIGSKWINEGSVQVGFFGDGTVDILDGGSLSSAFGLVGYQANSVGRVNVSGAGSEWADSTAIYVGVFGSGILDIQFGGKVINQSDGAIGLGENGTGEVSVSGLNSVWENQDSLYIGGNTLSATGSGILNINNGGQVSVSNTTKVWGTINLDGGELLTDLLDVQSGANIAGYGTVTVTSGALNQGLILSDSGTLNIFGEFENSGTGEVQTSNNSTTSFHDNVVHNGTEMRTDSGSGLVFMSDFSGSGPFTGAGLVTFAGALNPGNSPGVMSFEGDLALTDTANLFIEIEGLALGEYDLLNVSGDFSIDSSLLSVSLNNGFSLNNDDEFLFVNVDGLRSGFFDGFGQDSLVGTYGNQRLFINYMAGDGNDIALYAAAVPEPGSLFLCGLIGVAVIARRRRSNK